MSKKPTADSPGSLGYRPGLSHDSRTDLGYATTKQKFHAPRQKGSSFPYEEEPDPIDDLEEPALDYETLKKIDNKVSTPYNSHDSLIGRTADSFYLIGGNSRVAIGEAVAKGMVPFPGMYKKRIQVGGGANSPKLVAPGQYNRTGTYRGWSHAPIPADEIIHKSEDDYVESTDEDNVEKVRSIVRSILKNNAREA